MKLSDKTVNLARVSDAVFTGTNPGRHPTVPPGTVVVNPSGRRFEPLLKKDGSIVVRQLRRGDHFLPFDSSGIPVGFCGGSWMWRGQVRQILVEVT